MAYISKTFYSLEDLARHLKVHQPSFYFSSKTSTVVPYDKLETLLNWQGTEDFYLCDLSKLPTHMEILANDHLLIKGAISWDDAKKFLKSRGKNLKTSPTEQLALVTAGVATSCTGERCFGFGTMRSQVKRLKYLNFEGEEIELKQEELFPAFAELDSYQKEYAAYTQFKNAPYPRFERATDLMLGTEGQLGIITEVEIETTPDFPVTYVFLLLPRWEENFTAHLEIYQAVQKYRGQIISCELLDSNCMNYLKADEKLGQNEDVIFLEIKSEDFENVYEHLLCNLTLTSIDKVFEINENKFHHIRAGVPRAIFERNSQMGVVKVGTDVQVSGDQFENLLNFYREASRIGINYCLFGHFGDAHLHYNFMPTKTETEKCLDEFTKLYEKVFQWHGSPFAEHGIGLIKQKYIKRFHGMNQKAVFKELKKQYDPYNQFFPQGFMNLGQ